MAGADTIPTGDFSAIAPGRNVFASTFGTWLA